MYSSKMEIDEWKKKDPIKKFTDVVEKQFPEIISAKIQMNEDLDHLIEKSWQEAFKSSCPKEAALLDKVFYNGQ